MEGGTVKIALTGTRRKDEIEIVTSEKARVEPPQKIQTTPELPPGEEEITEGIPGGTVEVWRIIHHHDGNQTEERLHVDSYYPYPSVVKRGER